MKPMRLNPNDLLSKPVYTNLTHSALSCLLSHPGLYIALYMVVAGSRFSQEGRIQLVGV